MVNYHIKYSTEKKMISFDFIIIVNRSLQVEVTRFVTSYYHGDHPSNGLAVE